MTTIAAGSSLTLGLNKGGSILIVTGGGFGSIRETAASGGVTTTNFGQAPFREMFGPYSEATSVVITNTSCPSLDYDADVGRLDPSSVAITGGVIGGQAVPAVAIAGQLLRRPLNLSILTNSFGAQFGNWAQELCGASGGLLQFFYNGGISGNTSAQMLARVGTIPAGTDVCFVLEGTNDAAGAVTSAQHAANMLAICQALLARGILPVLCAPPPKNSSGTVMAQYRVAEYQLARKYGVLLYDPFGGYFDPASTTGAWTSGADAGDGTHPSQQTYRDAGRALLSQIQGSASRVLTQPKNNGWAGIISNNLNLTATGGLGSQWTAAVGTPTTTTPSGSGDGILGNWQTASVTAATGSQGVSTGNMALPTGAADGDEYLIRCAIKGNVTSGSPGFTYFLRWKNASSVGLRDDFFFFNSVIGSFPAKYWEQVVTVPPGAVSAQFQASMTGAGAYSADVSIGEMAIVNLTRAAGF